MAAASVAVVELTDRQKKWRAAEAKGKRLERTIKAWLESQGWLVETAPKVVVWKFVPAQGCKVPMVKRHDLFGVWDGIALSESCRAFYQVTTLTNVARKRTKIERSGVPASFVDAIYAYVGRPGKWRVLRGPDFAMPGETMRCSAPRPTRRMDRT